MSGFFLIATVILVFIVIFQIAKASEYVSVLKGEKKSREQSNRINGFLMIAFLVVGLIGVYWCNDLLYKKTLFPVGSASAEGKDIDRMLIITIAITGFVFLITQILLFYFAWRYQAKEDRKAFFYPHNNKLEVIWTTVPAITLLILVVFGLKTWFKITGEAPKEAVVVEITGKQFGWIYRYPGKDGVFGKTFFRNISDKDNNVVGQLWDDKANEDDIIETSVMHIPVGTPVKLVIHSRDVIHDVGLSQFRLKMDAVPGIPTTMWFTPIYTTAQMKEKTNNPDFVYEISCDQMCGKGHFGMRGVIQVDTPEEYAKWLASKEPNYWTVFPDKKPKVPEAAPAAIDSTKQASATSEAPKVLAKN